MTAVIDVQERVKKINTPWSPIELAKVNDQVVRLAWFKGEFPWHKHTNEDELFFVLEGSIVIRIKGNPDVPLHKGQMAVIPKSVEHSPRSPEGSYVLMFEPYGLRSKGD
jgi:mannose-6-phosphate isomerase-like protein (cupin superfamily)